MVKNLKTTTDIILINYDENQQHNLEYRIRNSNMFTKLKSSFWNWMSFSSAFGDFKVEIYLIT